MNLNQVTIPVTDVERSVHFYTTLGLILIVRALPRYARFDCPDGDATFSLHQAEKQKDAEGIRVYFEVRNLDAVVAELIAQGVDFEELPVDKPWLWREARLKYPDGNQIILYFGGDNRKNPPWKI
jgi:catechol 2,3-dioxygenase-like lactoylglutathione lyase family enzyme